MRSSKRPAVVPGATSGPEPSRAATLAPAVPRRTQRPRWWDPRIIGGLVLVVAAVVVGARVVGASSRTSSVWACAHDLSAGTVLTADDLVPVDVNLGDSASHYLLAQGGSGAAPTGRTVTAPVHQGELLPVGALATPRNQRVIVIGVAPDRMPPGVVHGSTIDLYLVTGGTTGGAGASTNIVASGITVQTVTAPSSGGLSGVTSSQYQLSVLLDPTTADRLVKTLPTGAALVVLETG